MALILWQHEPSRNITVPLTTAQLLSAGTTLARRPPKLIGGPRRLNYSGPQQIDWTVAGGRVVPQRLQRVPRRRGETCRNESEPLVVVAIAEREIFSIHNPVL